MPARRSGPLPAQPSTATTPAAAARPRTVWVVASPGVLLLDYAGVLEPLRIANRVAGGGAFELRTVGPEREVPTSLGIPLAQVEPLPAALGSGDWLILVGNMTAPPCPAALVERAQSALIDWLGKVAAPRLAAGELRLLTVCSGALVAGRAGLLDGRECTTHHGLIGELRRVAPRATVLENRIYVVDGNVATSAGITAGIDLALFAISDALGVQTALEVARDLVVFHRRAGADPQLSPLLEFRNHLHPALHRAQDAVLAAPTLPWTAALLAERVHLSVRQLTRVFRSNAGITPLDYINRTRFTLARRMLQESSMPVERVAESAGFSSAHHLRRVWRKFADEPPSAAVRRRRG